MRYIETFLLPIFLIACNFTTFGQKKTNSVLSSGDIYKFSIENTGMYKLDYTFLKSISDLDIDLVDPRKINIYSSGGGPVPQIIAEQRIDDLEAVPIKIIGEEDGSFDQSDYILVFMEGADVFKVNQNEIKFLKNVYSSENHFFLKTNDDVSIRVPIQQSVANPAFVSNSTELVKRHEIDRLNLLGNFSSTQGSGKQWFGESFTNEPIQNFDASFTIPNLVPGSLSRIEVLFASRSGQTTQVELEVDGQKFTKNISPTSLGNIEAVYAKLGRIAETINLQSSSPKITISYDKSSNTSEGWLDYIQLTTRSFIESSSDPIFLFDRTSNNYPSFGFELPSGNLTTWNVTDITRITEIVPNNNIVSTSNSGQIDVLITFDENNINSLPIYISKLNLQNLHAINRADFVIIYYAPFKDAAENLAQHRRNHDGMVVVTAKVSEIYNEFGGENDPSAIRDFAKMIYDRDSNFKYMLLFGDGSYDYRGIVPGLEYQNFVPTYQTDESLHPVEAFPSDDFFALLSDQEGEDSLDGALDIGVGRIPAKTLSEATGVIDKIIHYDTSKKTLGDWKLRIGFTADDEDSNTHIKQADGIAKLVENINPEMNQQKVYFDAFNQEATPGGARYPDANNALNTNLLNGQLVLNYLGHGGPKGWAQERVFQISDIANLKNIDRLPLLITATCSFTGFDEPAFVSAGEQSLLNPSGGAIGLFSTVRAVYSSQNERITREVFKKIFTRVDGKALRFGDIIRESQNANSSDTLSSNTRKFLLFGDPAQRLALPQQKVQIIQVNDEDIEDGQIDTIGALGRLKLAGQITDHQDNLLSDFNGEVFLTVFDKPSNLKTLDNDGEDRIYDFTLRKNILYKGSASVQNGLYEIELILPKDINFDYGPGHFSLYATDNISRDAGGLYNGIVIGGTSEGGITDNEGPEIDIYFDDRTFTFGGQTGKNPVLIVDLSDETGINLSSTSIGHDITATFDNDNNNNLILNEYYQPQVDKVGSGSIEFQLSEFEPGLHTLTLKAWDILNNSSEKLSEFLVVQNEEGFINNVYNYPNPFSTQTNFTFEHDLGNSNLDIVINIFTVSGKLVKTIQTQRFASGSLINDVPWNANDDFESKLAKGIYFYKINISSPELNLRRESDFQKLVILN